MLTGTISAARRRIAAPGTIDIDGMSVKSCTMFAVQAQGSDIMTIEGVANAMARLSALRTAFRMMHGLQCGFSPPGMNSRRSGWLQENAAAHGRRNPEWHFRQYSAAAPATRTSLRRSVRRRQDIMALNPGGCGMNDMTPTREQREANSKAWAASASGSRTPASTRGKGN